MDIVNERIFETEPDLVVNKEVNTYDKLYEMLPNELKPEECATNIKTVLKLYASYCDSGDKLTYEYRELLDIYTAIGNEIDFIGVMFSVFRDIGEEDTPYKNRIIKTIQNRKTPTTIPEIQQAINSVVETGQLYVLENHNGKPCNVYLTGTADSDSINRALILIDSFLPAGVYSIVPIISFEAWQNIKDQFPTWDSLGLEGYIW